MSKFMTSMTVLTLKIRHDAVSMQCPSLQQRLSSVSSVLLYCVFWQTSGFAKILGQPAGN